MDSKDVDPKQKPAVATETKGMTTPEFIDWLEEGGETASKSQKVEEGDQATKRKVRLVKCTPEFIDWLERMEKRPPPPTLSLDGLDGPMLRCDEAIKKLLDTNAELLQQYRTTGEAYAEVYDEPFDHPLMRRQFQS